MANRKFACNNPNPEVKGIGSFFVWKWHQVLNKIIETNRYERYNLVPKEQKKVRQRLRIQILPLF